MCSAYERWNIFSTPYFCLQARAVNDLNEQITSLKVGEGLAPPELGRLISTSFEVGEGLAPPELGRLISTSFEVGEGLAPPKLGRLISTSFEVGEGLAPPELGRLVSSIVSLFKNIIACMWSGIIT